MSDKSQTSTPEQKPLFGVLPDGKVLDIPVIGLCGGYGSGKTLAGLTLCPEETIEIGVEDSGVTYSLPIKHRFSMYKEVTGKGNTVPKPIDCWDWFRGIVDRIRKDELKCRVLFIDPITDLQNGLVDWVRAHPGDFGKTASQYEKGGGLIWGDVKSHAKILLGNLSGKCTLIFTAHMGSVWNGGAPVAGKVKAKGLDTFKELASLYVYLTREVDPTTGKQPDKPVGHICPPHGKSRLSHMMCVNGDWQSTPLLPPRIPEFTWAALRKYVGKPPDYKKLSAGEKADIEKLSDDDKLLLEAEVARVKLEEAQLRKELAEKSETAARRIAEANKPPMKTQSEEPVSPKQEPAATAAETPSEPAASIPAAPEPFVWFRENCMQAVRDQIAQLNMTAEQVKQSCAKRGCATLDEMADDKLEDFRKGLWSVIEKREMEKKQKKY